MEEYRVEIKVKNNNILKKIEEAGYASVREFCRLNNKMNWNSRIGEYVNLKATPLNAEGEFYNHIWEMCEILNCSPENLFSEVQLNTAIESNKRTLQVNEAEMKFMLENQPDQNLLEDIVHQDRLPENIDKVLKTLTPREEKVLRLRMGLNDEGKAHTLEEVAKQFDVTRTRIREIEATALRKLRHFSRAEHLIEYLP